MKWIHFAPVTIIPIATIPAFVAYESIQKTNPRPHTNEPKIGLLEPDNITRQRRYANGITITYE